MSFSGNNGQAFEKLGYGLRLIAGSLWVCSGFFRLTRLADRDTKTVQAFRRDLKQLGYRSRRRWSLNVLYVPLVHYQRLIRSMPRLAGRVLPADLDELERKRRDFTLACEGSGRGYLPASLARSLQERFIKCLFQGGLGLPLKPSHLSVFSSYAESAVLVRDFLDFCLARVPTGQRWSRGLLTESLDSFERILRLHLVPGVCTLPPKAMFAPRRIESSAALVRALHPGESMAEFYDRRRTLLSSKAYQDAPSWMLDALDRHLGRLETISVLDFQTVLSCEMHLQGCALLCGIASGGPASVSPPEISGPFAVRLDNLWKSLCLACGDTTMAKAAAPSIAELR